MSYPGDPMRWIRDLTRQQRQWADLARGTYMPASAVRELIEATELPTTHAYSDIVNNVLP